MATIIGTVGVFGFDEDQQGILLESQDIDYKPDSKVQRDYRGKKVGIIFYDDQTDVSMKGSIHRYLMRDAVPYKQYFYALRPLLAARWAMQERKAAPVPFADLRHLLPDDMQSVTDELLVLRNNSSEKAIGPSHPAADAFIARELAALDNMLAAMPNEPEPDTSPLDDFFRRVVSNAGVISA